MFFQALDSDSEKPSQASKHSYDKDKETLDTAADSTEEITKSLKSNVVTVDVKVEGTAGAKTEETGNDSINLAADVTELNIECDGELVTDTEDQGNISGVKDGKEDRVSIGKLGQDLLAEESDNNLDWNDDEAALDCYNDPHGNFVIVDAASESEAEDNTSNKGKRLRRESNSNTSVLSANSTGELDFAEMQTIDELDEGDVTVHESKGSRNQEHHEKAGVETCKDNKPTDSLCREAVHAGDTKIVTRETDDFSPPDEEINTVSASVEINASDAEASEPCDDNNNVSLVSSKDDTVEKGVASPVVEVDVEQPVVNTDIKAADEDRVIESKTLEKTTLTSEGDGMTENSEESGTPVKTIVDLSPKAMKNLEQTDVEVTVAENNNENNSEREEAFSLHDQNYQESHNSVAVDQHKQTNIEDNKDTNAQSSIIQIMYGDDAYFFGQVKSEVVKKAQDVKPWNILVEEHTTEFLRKLEYPDFENCHLVGSDKEEEMHVSNSAEIQSNVNSGKKKKSESTDITGTDVIEDQIEQENAEIDGSVAEAMAEMKSWIELQQEDQDALLQALQERKMQLLVDQFVADVTDDTATVSHQDKSRADVTDTDTDADADNTATMSQQDKSGADPGKTADALQRDATSAEGEHSSLHSTTQEKVEVCLLLFFVHIRYLK